MFVTRACRLPILAALSALAMSGCMRQPYATAAKPQPRNELDAFAYGPAPHDSAKAARSAKVATSRPGLFTGNNFAAADGEPSPLAKIELGFASMTKSGADGSAETEEFMNATAMVASDEVSIEPDLSLTPDAQRRLSSRERKRLAKLEQRRLAALRSTMQASASIEKPVSKPLKLSPSPTAAKPIAAATASADPITTAAIPAPTPYNSDYALDAGDKLRVVVFGQEGLTNTYLIDASGSINMPLIGRVSARGMSPAALASSITSKLKNGFIRDPSVAVEVDTYRPFFILGEVAAPGQYPYVPGMSVEAAVAVAGGFSPRAQRDIVTVTQRAAGNAVRTVLPLGATIKPGDTVVVGERWF